MPFDEEELDPHGECAAEIAFWKSRAVWWCAYAENGLRSEPDNVDLLRAEKIIALEGIEKR